MKRSEELTSCQKTDGSLYCIKRLHEVPELIDECCNLINTEWKRSHTARLRSIQGSSENFPMSLLLLKKAKKQEVVGHCKISRLSTSNTKVFVETVVIHPSLRGKGLGKVLMKEVENVCRSKNIKQIYLTTKGQEGFYEKLGYTSCPPVSLYGCQFNNSDEDISETSEKIKPMKNLAHLNNNVINSSPPPPPPPPPPPKITLVTEFNNFQIAYFNGKFNPFKSNVALAYEYGAKKGKPKFELFKMRDYTTNNYCDFLWISDLLELKKSTKNEFTLEIQKDKKSIKCNFVNVIIFGTIVEVKEVGHKGVLYQVDDGTGVITCKANEEQFQEILSIIENEQANILNETVDVQQSLGLSSMTDCSADDSVFNDKSLQTEDITFNERSKLRGLQSLWDDIYESFSTFLGNYSIGDSVIIEGKLYTYFNTNQIHINSIRPLDFTEEIMLQSIKLKDGLDQSKQTNNSKTKSEVEKRLSGLATFDNIPHLNPKISIPNIEVPQLNDDVLNKPEIVTPNLNPTITFDTFISSP